MILPVIAKVRGYNKTFQAKVRNKEREREREREREDSLIKYLLH